MTDNKRIDSQARKTLFDDARTYSTWHGKDVPDDVLREIYETLKFGPTSANCSPARLIFVKSKEAKERLKTHLDEGNVEKTMAAPVTVIIAHDMDFYESLPKLFPHTDARSWFVGNEALIQETAFRNSSLQGAYLILAARSYGLDCGPMSGFDAEGVGKTFFGNKNWKANFLCNLGYGKDEDLHPRSPRFDFDEVGEII